MNAATLCMLLLFPQASTAEVKDLVRKLDADRFAERRAATQRLTEMGAEVFDELIKAANSPSAEVSQRALDILTNHFDNGEAAIRAAAKSALEKIANTDSQAGRRAKLALSPDATTPNEQLARQRMAAQQIQIAQIQAQIRARNAQRVIRPAPFGGGALPANAMRRIQFSDGKQSIKIEVKGKEIKMEVTEKKDGKSTTKKYEAKDEDDLKKKHPEAYKLFKKHSGGVQARIAAPRIQVAPARPVPKAPNAIPPGVRQRILDAIKRSQERIEKDKEKAKENLQGPELDRALESLKRREESLQKTRKRYEDMQG